MAERTRYERAKAIYVEVCDLESSARRERLEALVADDAELRGEVEELLRYDPGNGSGEAGEDESSLEVSVDAPTIALTADRGSLTVVHNRLEPGERAGPYVIESTLGEGGMGVVYRASDERLQRHVALKFLQPGLFADHDARERFLREARMASALDHPNICTIFDLGEHDGGAYLAMAYYPGATLATQLRDGPLLLEQCLHVTRQVATGLAAAHSVGVIHRDIKPANLMVLEDGTVKILDFGLAKTHGGASMTRTGQSLGTPSAMAPEQARGHTTGPRTDVWAVGVLIFEMLSSAPPFAAGNLPGLLYAIVHEPHRPLRDAAPTAPRWLSAVVDRCLAKDPDDRYADAGELLAALYPPPTADLADDHLADSDALSSDASAAVERLSSGPSRWPLIALVGVAITALLLLTLSGLFQSTVAPADIHTESRADDASDIEAGDVKARLATTGRFLAILPFETAIDDAELGILGSGLAQRVTHALATFTDLSVVAQASVRQLSSSGLTLDEMARQLGASYLVVGQIEAAGERLAVSAELVEAASGRAIWGERFEAPSEELARLEQRVSSQIVSALEERVSVDARFARAASSEPDPEAYRLLLRGMYKLGTPEAVEPLRAAVSVDPTFVDAWANLSRAYAYVGYFGDSRPEAAFPAAIAAAQQALELDPQSPEALAAYVQARAMGHGEVLETLEYGLRAVELGPGSSFARYIVGAQLINADRPSVALPHLERALELDPLGPAIRMMITRALLRLHAWDEAIATCRANLEIHPRFIPSHEQLAAALWFSGERAQALDVLRAAGPALAWWLPVYEGPRERALAYLAEQAEANPPEARWHAVSMATAYGLWGEDDPAIDWMEKLTEPHDRLLAFQIFPVPHLDPIRDAPRLRELLDTVGAPESFGRVAPQSNLSSRCPPATCQGPKR